MAISYPTFWMPLRPPEFQLRQARPLSLKRLVELQTRERQRRGLRSEEPATEAAGRVVKVVL